MSVHTAALANGGRKENRRELDFYPTPPDATEALMRFLALPPMTVLEPACGDGAMSKVIERHGHTVVSTDLRHTGFGTGGIDYLTAAPIECGAIITNPPFAVADQFIRKATREAPIVAMLLKSQYWHARSRTQLFSDTQPSAILPLTWRPNFLDSERGGSPTMDVIWTVWVRGEKAAKYVPLPRPANDNQPAMARGAA